ncbi:MAG: hypothetical protein LBC68_05775, partial [Prevotellaceae bacterium]|nr:hypothetical protein [Prevotellaceae bacterium]
RNSDSSTIQKITKKLRKKFHDKKKNVFRSSLIQKLRGYWDKLDRTVEEGTKLLETLCTVEVQLDGNIPILYVPKPQKEIEQLFTGANITSPEILPKKIKTKTYSNRKLKNVACK